MQLHAFDSETSESLRRAYDEAVAAMDQLQPMRGAAEKAQAKTQIIMALIHAAENGERDRARLLEVADQAMFDTFEGHSTVRIFASDDLAGPLGHPMKRLKPRDQRVWLIDKIERTRSEWGKLLEGSAFNVTDEFSHIALIDIGSYNNTPDLILATMDMLSDGGDDLSGLGRLRGREPNSRVVVFDKQTSVIGLTTAMKAGAYAYLESEIPRDDLLLALELVVAGERVIPRELVQRLLSGSAPQASA